MKNYMSIIVLALLCTTSIFAQKDEFEFGLASYYSDKYHGKPTASGELYDMNRMTAAHRTLPFGTTIKVTRLDNKKSVTVKVNDRGPFIPERVVDLSKAAARQIGMLQDGETKIKLEIVKKGSADEPVLTRSKTVKKEPTKAYEEKTAAVQKPKPTEKKATPAKTETKATTAKKVDKTSLAKKEESKKVKEKKATTSSKARLVKGKNFQPYDLYKIDLMRPEKKGFGVQVASLTNYEGVFKQIAELQGEWFKNILLSVEKGSDDKAVYKIILGPFEDQESAASYKNALKKKKINGFVVNLEGIAY